MAVWEMKQVQKAPYSYAQLFWTILVLLMLFFFAVFCSLHCHSTAISLSSFTCSCCKWMGLSLTYCMCSWTCLSLVKKCCMYGNAPFTPAFSGCVRVCLSSSKSKEPRRVYSEPLSVGKAQSGCIVLGQCWAQSISCPCLIYQRQTGAELGLWRRKQLEVYIWRRTTSGGPRIGDHSGLYFPKYSSIAVLKEQVVGDRLFSNPLFCL